MGATFVGRPLNAAVTELLDKLIACWSDGDQHERYRMTAQSTRIAKSTSFDFLPPNERLIADALRQELPAAQFALLPEMVATRRLEQAIKAAGAPGARNLAARRADQAQRDARMRAEAAAKKRELAAERADEAQREVSRKAAAAAAEREAAARRERRDRFVAQLEATLKDDFLSADRLFASAANGALVSRDDFEELKLRFVSEWAEHELNIPLDRDQAAAVGGTEGHLTGRRPGRQREDKDDCRAGSVPSEALRRRSKRDARDGVQQEGRRRDKS